MMHPSSQRRISPVLSIDYIYIYLTGNSKFCIMKFLEFSILSSSKFYLEKMCKNINNKKCQQAIDPTNLQFRGVPGLPLVSFQRIAPPATPYSTR